jgi:hypothetical protein
MPGEQVSDEIDVCESEASAETVDNYLSVRAREEDANIEICDIKRFIAESASLAEVSATKRAIRQDAKRNVKASRRITAEGKRGILPAESNSQAVIKPGSKNGRVARALQDPYGCHRSDQHFI